MADVVLNVPVNGASPVDMMRQDPPPGAYEVEITATSDHTKKGDTSGKISYEFRFSIVEPCPAQGIGTSLYMGSDWTEPMNVGHFVNLYTGVMEHLGKTPEEIKAKLAGTVQAPLSAFVGKHAFVIVKPVPDELDAQGRKKLADKNFVTKTQYVQLKKTIAALGMQTPPPKTATATAPTGGPAPVNGATGAAGTIATGGPIPPPPPGAAGTPAIGDLFS
jgi:hypothetical protein